MARSAESIAARRSPDASMAGPAARRPLRRRCHGVFERQLHEEGRVGREHRRIQRREQHAALALTAANEALQLHDGSREDGLHADEHEHRIHGC